MSDEWNMLHLSTEQCADSFVRALRGLIINCGVIWTGVTFQELRWYYYEISSKSTPLFQEKIFARAQELLREWRPPKTYWDLSSVRLHFFPTIYCLSQKGSLLFSCANVQVKTQVVWQVAESVRALCSQIRIIAALMKRLNTMRVKTTCWKGWMRQVPAATESNTFPSGLLKRATC